jgi:hypothetical protein
MKFLKCAILLLVMTHFMVDSPAKLFAQYAPDNPEDVKMLRQAAQEIKPTNPELAYKVNMYADMEQEELLGRMGAQSEAAMLKVAARALQDIDPVLAKKMDVFADKEIKEAQEAGL